MALVPATLESALLAALEAQLPGPTPAQILALTTLSTAMAAAIDTYIRSATINYASGLANGGGAVTGTFVGSLT